MKKIALFALLASVCALVPAVATAGLKLGESVSIVGKKVRGNLGWVHNTGDNVQFIGCQDFGTWVSCAGRDATGKTVQCSSSNAGHMASARSLNASSMLEFDIANGACAYITAMNGSQHSVALTPRSSMGIALP